MKPCPGSIAGSLAILHNSLLSEQLSELPSGSINPPSTRAPERPSYMDALTQPPSDAAVTDSLWMHFHTLTHQGCCRGEFGFLAAETLSHTSASLLEVKMGCWL